VFVELAHLHTDLLKECAAGRDTPSMSDVPPVGPVDASRVPRYAGLSTFARLPRREDVLTMDVAVVGVPFDSGVSYRPGARFGPAHIRQSSRLLRPFNPALDIAPFAALQVVDAGDVAVNPFDIKQAIGEIEEAAVELGRTARLMALGGDHTIVLPLLRAMHSRHGRLAVLHFDAHLDTWDTYFGEPYTHGTPFRRAAEEGLLDPAHCMHVGIRGPLYDRSDLPESANLGFDTVHASQLDDLGIAGTIERVRARLGDRPVYVSVDIDVLDPSHAPGTGTPEAGGMTSRELLGILRGLRGLDIVSADVVEVAPAYDHAEITGIAAAHVAYELLSLFATNIGGFPIPLPPDVGQGG
jgi:agmatinase